METSWKIIFNLPCKKNIWNSLTPFFWKDEAEDKVPMLEEVDVDIDGRAHIGQQTGHVTRAF